MNTATAINAALQELDAPISALARFPETDMAATAALEYIDFQPVFTDEQIRIRKFEAGYNKTWGVWRRLTMMALVRSSAQLLDEFGKNDAPDELLEMAEHIIKHRNHLERRHRDRVCRVRYRTAADSCPIHYWIKPLGHHPDRPGQAPGFLFGGVGSDAALNEFTYKVLTQKPESKKAIPKNGLTA